MSSQKRKRYHSDKGSRNIPVNTKRSIEKQFEKKFSYKIAQKDNGNDQKTTFTIHVRSCDTLHQDWVVDKYLKMKSELNELKNNLNDKDMVSWHQHTRTVNLAGNIAPEIKNRLRPELCTQAWCKFFEIASAFLKIDICAPYFSVHLCEAPGAFVTSMNQFLLTIGYCSEWKWLATTLNPYYEGNNIGEMIDDDRFIRCSHDSWYFGEDDTGNLMSAKNLQALADMVKDLRVDLVTADGSIDCQGDPAEQENVVSRLQHCETLTALQILSPGGTFVVKTFTMFECKSICLMYLMNCMFDKVDVFKPCTSKGGNSEVYVICQGYKGKGEYTKYLDDLTALYFGEEETTGCLFSKSDIPSTFFDRHSQCTEFFKDCQMTAIQRNLDLYKIADDEKSMLELEKDYCVECFFTHYNIKPMLYSARIMKLPKGRKNNRNVHNNKTSEGRNAEFAARIKMEGKFIGSFQERQQLSVLPWKQKMYKFDTYEEEVDKADNSLWIQCQAGPLQTCEIEHLQLTSGKCVGRIDSSRFCHGYFLAQSHEIIRNAEWLANQQEMDVEFIRMVADHLTTVISESLKLYIPDFGTQSVPQDNTGIRHDQTQSNTGMEMGMNTALSSLSSCSYLQLNVGDMRSSESAGANTQCSDETSTGLAMEWESNNTQTKTTREVITNPNKVAEKGNQESEMREAESNVTEHVHSTNEKTKDYLLDTKGKMFENAATEIAVKDFSGLNGQPLNGARTLPVDFVCLHKHKPSVVLKLLPGLVPVQSSNLLPGLVPGQRAQMEVVAYSVAADVVDDKFELKEQLRLCESVLGITQNTPPGDLVVIEMGSCLTRVTAGLVYILYRSFREIGFVHHYGNLLQRHLVCASYQHCPMILQQYLKEACQMMDSNQSESVLEIFPIHTLLDDADFTNFLHISNSNLLQSFITTTINKEKELHENS